MCKLVFLIMSLVLNAHLTVPFPVQGLRIEAEFIVFFGEEVLEYSSFCSEIISNRNAVLVWKLQMIFGAS